MTIALYIHIPYCLEKCPYCDFNSYAGAIHSNFVSALKEEIILRSKGLKGYSVKSIFFGGGTPTVLPGDQISDILNCCIKTFSIASDCEISIEANPGTVNYKYFKTLKESGFNRLSLGCQSFENSLLKKVGRIHDSKDIDQSVSAAQEAGFENISLDLMFGLPGQSLEVWRETLQKAVQLKPTHLSLYNLTVEKNTPFDDQLKSGELVLPGEELQLEMYQWTIDYLSKSNYIHYEISNFAIKDYECRHNIVYWNNKEYLGFGPGAASYFNGSRSLNLLSPEEYIETLLNKKEVPIAEEEKLDSKRTMGETLMLGLRMLKGIDPDDFKRRFGKSIDSEFGEKIDQLKSDQLLEYEAGKLKLTSKGILYSNEVFMEFL